MVPNDERGVPVMGVDIVKTKWGWQLCPPGDQFVTGSLERWGVYSEVEVEILKAVAQAGGGGCMVAGGNIGAVAIAQETKDDIFHLFVDIFLGFLSNLKQLKKVIDRISSAYFNHFSAKNSHNT